MNKKLNAVEVSQIVGFGKSEVPYPSAETVEAAKDDGIQLLTWYRYLPSPTNDEETSVLDDVIRHWHNFKRWNPSPWGV